MMKHSLYLWISLGVVTVACEKEYAYEEPVPFEIDNTELVGDYEWSWSKLPSGAIVESTTSQIDYGFRIKATGYIYTFQNGVEINKFSFKEYFTQWGKQGIRSYQNENYDQFIALDYEGEMQVQNFPYTNFSNYFYKHE